MDDSLFIALRESWEERGRVIIALCEDDKELLERIKREEIALEKLVKTLGQ